MQVENLINSQRVPRKLNGLTGHAVWIGGMNRTVALGRNCYRLWNNRRRRGNGADSE